MLPLLRVQTEHSYRQVYGPVDIVAERLKDIGCGFAAIVDTSGTWGHVQWDKACKARGITPAFGAAFEIKDEDSGRKPMAWALAEDARLFYNFSSSNPVTPGQWVEAPGVIRFAGHALTDPETFDYVDLGHQSLLAGRKALDLAKRTKKPIILAPTNDYPGPEHRNRFMAWADNAKMATQHILTTQELRAAYHWLTDSEFKKAQKNTLEVAERIGQLELAKAPLISVNGNIVTLAKKGKCKRLAAGQIEAWTPEYEQRLQRELKMIKEKKFESYFLVVSDLVSWAKKHMLVGPARGSSAGSLVCYLLSITEVDPIPHGLLFERFIDVNRNDLPDIDIDFNDAKRHLVFEYLAEKYGTTNVARIGSINRLQARSVVAHVCKKLGINHGATFPVLNVLIEYSSGDSRFGKGLEDTLTNTQPGRDFMARYPEAALMGELEQHASHTGVHAAGVIVSTEPVIDFCTVRDGIAQLDKKDAEILNLLKIDALGLRTLGVIEDAGVITQEELYTMKMDDPEVFKVINDGRYAGIFQFEGSAQRSVARGVEIKEFMHIDHVTALARPGPLGGGAAAKYVERHAGRAFPEYSHHSMKAYLEETYGLVLYQEQVMKIVREIGEFSWEDTSAIRKAMSGRKGQEYFNKHGENFVKGAKKLKIPKEIATTIWNEICNFGAWGMNKSHTTSYAMISYWCAYMKRYHPIEYAAALMRNAKDDEQVMETLRELAAEGTPYIPFDPWLSEANWSAKNGKLIGGYTNLVGIGPVKAAAYIRKRNAKSLTEKDLEQLAARKVKYSELRPAHAMWQDVYDNPDKYNVHGEIKEFAQLEDRENAVVICQLLTKERRDDNEAARVGKRNGEVKKGQTLFLDLFVVDDSVSKPVRARIQKRDWFSLGVPLADYARNGIDWFIIRGTWLNSFTMMSVEKIKPLNNPEIFK